MDLAHVQRTDNGYFFPYTCALFMGLCFCGCRKARPVVRCLLSGLERILCSRLGKRFAVSGVQILGILL